LNPYISRFSTDAYPREQQFKAWRDEVNAVFAVDIEKQVN
jgi:hypothetical protein